MRALKLLQLMTANSAAMSEQLVNTIRESGRCKDLLEKVPEAEQRQYAAEIFRDLTEWLSYESDGIIEQQYISIGARRHSQRVPITDLFWAVSAAREYLSNYTQQECLHDDKTDFLGGVTLLQSLNRFFDRTFYFALIGYQEAEQADSAAVSVHSERWPA